MVSDTYFCNSDNIGTIPVSAIFTITNDSSSKRFGLGANSRPLDTEDSRVPKIGVDNFFFPSWDFLLRRQKWRDVQRVVLLGSTRQSSVSPV